MKQLISQSHAARLKGCSRQRINELIAEGRLARATDANGKTLGGVWLEDVESLQLKSVGRPRLTEEELASRTDRFQVGEIVIWKFQPRGGFGYSITIPATVVKLSQKRLQLSLMSKNDVLEVVWADRNDCIKLDDFASDNACTPVLTKDFNDATLKAWGSLHK